MREFVAFIFCLTFSFTVFAQEENQVGKKAPNFKLEDSDGNIFELNKETGSYPILLSFWATWCKPCVEEMAEFNVIYSELKSKGFKMFAISTDNEKTVSKVKPFVKSKGYSFPILLDTNSEVARKYYAKAVPFTVLIDKNGHIVYSHLGYMRGDEVQVKKKIEELLKN